MSTLDEMAEMIVEEGLPPTEVAKRYEISLEAVFHYIDELVGRGHLRRSDIVFSVPPEQRQAIFDEIPAAGEITPEEVLARLEKRGVQADEGNVAAVLRYAKLEYSLGELYENLRFIEVQIHEHIRHHLTHEYGPDESGWWRKGVPRPVRVKCQTRREEDDEMDDPPEPYCYTDIIDLRAIYDQQWKLLSKDLAPDVRNNKKLFLAGFIRLNQIRRMVMHPVRGGRPTADDFEFIRDIMKRLHLHKCILEHRRAQGAKEA